MNSLQRELYKNTNTWENSVASACRLLYSLYIQVESGRRIREVM